MRGDALRDLVLVVRKDEIEPAAVNVEGLAQKRLAHRRAFDVPAGPAAAPRALPAGQILGRRLPQHEIGGIALVGRDLDTRAGDELVARAARQAAVLGEAADREEDVMIGLVGMALGDEALDHRDHRRDVVGRARLGIGRQRQKRLRIGVKFLGRALGQLADGDAGGLGGGVDLVVDVGDVADIAHMRRAIGRAQQPVEHVEHDDRPRVADMRQVVDRGPAHIDAHGFGIERRELLLAPGERVVRRSKAAQPGCGAGARGVSPGSTAGSGPSSWNTLVMG